MRVVWEPSAHESLGAAVAWWMLTDARGLPAFLVELKDAIAQVASFPHSGRRIAADGDPQLRGVLVGPFRLTYRALDERVHLVLLQHLRRSSSSVDLTLLR